MYIVGIAGGSGSGKTTFAQRILEQLHTEIPLLHLDSYYLKEIPGDIHTKKGNPNFDHPGAFDWDLIGKHISDIKKGQNVKVPDYDFKNSTRLDSSTEVKPHQVVIIEGIFALYDPEIRQMMDLKIFLHVEADTRFTRRLHRDLDERGRSLDSVINQYYETVRPMYQKYLGPQRDHADIIVGEETQVASEVVASKLNTILDKKVHQLHRPSP